MPQRDKILGLKGRAPRILPSILGWDFGDVTGELRRLEGAGVVGLHLDIMDGHFVNNISFGVPVVRGIRQHCALPLDAHLMIAEPEKYIRPFAQAGADAISIHIEATRDPVKVLREVRDLGLASGIVVDHGTATSSLAPCVGECDMVLVMSVKAGFGGQAFQPVALDKLREVRDMFGPEVLLEIDGGLSAENVGDCVRAGAELLVIGSAITGRSDYSEAVRQLEAAIDDAVSPSS